MGFINLSNWKFWQLGLSCILNLKEFDPELIRRKTVYNSITRFFETESQYVELFSNGYIDLSVLFTEIRRKKGSTVKICVFLKVFSIESHYCNSVHLLTNFGCCAQWKLTVGRFRNKIPPVFIKLLIYFDIFTIYFKVQLFSFCL